MSFKNLYRGRRVLITGHTGFKGSWLAEWLLRLGAEVTGYALPAPTSPALFTQLGLAARVKHVEGDVRDLLSLCEVIDSARPEFVFHLAAQSLVRRSYVQPVETYAVNVMGVVNLLEAVRLARRPCNVIIVTTDKCYDNREWVHSYREEDAMGGHDPYSSSKGAAELVASSYRKSFFSSPDSLVRIASARAGNVIGGGDWSTDRIVPDCIRSLHKGEPIIVRNKHSTRPWQHVLEPLSGYLLLAAALSGELTDDLKSAPNRFTTAFNFGPRLDSNRAVGLLVDEVIKHWPGEWKDGSEPNAVHEAAALNLSIDKAHHLLGWQPVWNFSESLAQTVGWYRQHLTSNASPTSLVQSQISAYTESARIQLCNWVD